MNFNAEDVVMNELYYKLSEDDLPLWIIWQTAAVIGIRYHKSIENLRKGKLRILSATSVANFV